MEVESLVARDVPGVAHRPLDLGCPSVPHAADCIEPEVAVGGLDDTGDSAERPARDSEWKEARPVVAHDARFSAHPDMVGSPYDRRNRTDSDPVVVGE